FFPFNLKVALAAFVIFRIMDILKPWPVNRLQDLKGGMGIMIDDCVAGLYTILVVLGGLLALKLAGIDFY
ncbi:MAG TPA: phosphatidylglycerophosphatase A, partial [Spirochaetota bacterium]|nr:phosphatidylglycerophosphatase A [Spirochaetota bacterium]